MTRSPNISLHRVSRGHAKYQFWLRFLRARETSVLTVFPAGARNISFYPVSWWRTKHCFSHCFACPQTTRAPLRAARECARRFAARATANRRRLRLTVMAVNHSGCAWPGGARGASKRTERPTPPEPPRTLVLENSVVPGRARNVEVEVDTDAAHQALALVLAE